MNVKAFSCEDDNISPSVLGVGIVILPVISLEDCTDRVDGVEHVVRIEETENKLLLLITAFKEPVYHERN